MLIACLLDLLKFRLVTASDGRRLGKEKGVHRRSADALTDGRLCPLPGRTGPWRLKLLSEGRPA
jgi:hypothetical protein